jgi:ferredoxin
MSEKKPTFQDLLQRSRKNGTECILCTTCVENCPQKAIHL